LIKGLTVTKNHSNLISSFGNKYCSSGTLLYWSQEITKFAIFTKALRLIHSGLSEGKKISIENGTLVKSV
jgi:hypothetical protein